MNSNTKSVTEETPINESYEPKTVTISVDLANRIIQYLLQKPFNEVFELLPAFKMECDKSYLEQKGS